MMFSVVSVVSGQGDDIEFPKLTDDDFKLGEKVTTDPKTGGEEEEEFTEDPPLPEWAEEGEKKELTEELEEPKGFFGKIIDWFKNLFGIGVEAPAEEGLIAAPQKSIKMIAVVPDLLNKLENQGIFLTAQLEDELEAEIERIDDWVETHNPPTSYVPDIRKIFDNPKITPTIINEVLDDIEEWEDIFEKTGELPIGAPGTIEFDSSIIMTDIQDAAVNTVQASLASFLSTNRIAPEAASVVLGGTHVPVTLLVTDDEGVAQPGQSVIFKSSDGSIEFDPLTGVTDSEGYVSTEITTPNPGKVGEDLLQTIIFAEVSDEVTSNEAAVITVGLQSFDIVNTAVSNIQGDDTSN